ncbi:hypothetical protein CHARACLAT_023900 [Characodon lateralis]|uniref:Uncharacterized protein n=1 Tax=Characodon lateralis TaxID=208331 RepID=A0ABU7F824_9TELE|nr:hypothetical protein [Characodon lateralis]
MRAERPRSLRALFHNKPLALLSNTQLISSQSCYVLKRHSSPLSATVRVSELTSLLENRIFFKRDRGLTMPRPFIIWAPTSARSMISAVPSAESPSPAGLITVNSTRTEPKV